MNIIQIPKSFMLFGEKHKVKLLKKINKEDDLGYYDPNSNTIKLKKSNEIRSQDQVEQTFYHEAIHAALDNIGQTELSKSEEFVDTLAKALHQIWKSAEY